MCGHFPWHKSSCSHSIRVLINRWVSWIGRPQKTLLKNLKNPSVAFWLLQVVKDKDLLPGTSVPQIWHSTANPVWVFLNCNIKETLVSADDSSSCTEWVIPLLPLLSFSIQNCTQLRQPIWTLEAQILTDSKLTSTTKELASWVVLGKVLSSDTTCSRPFFSSRSLIRSLKKKEGEKSFSVQISYSQTMNGNKQKQLQQNLPLTNKHF